MTIRKWISHLFRIVFLALITVFPAGTVHAGIVSGVVVDHQTKEPVMAANVYISNTLWGSATGADGYYQIQTVPPGIHELVVTIVGYQFESRMILVVQDSSQKQNFSLKPLIYETEATEVVGEIPKDWLDNLDLFRKYFIGRSAFAEECRIINAEVLEFRKPSAQVLAASTDVPLEIENNALGFRIRTILLDFSVDRILNRWEWSVKPAFTEMEAADTAKQDLWNKNRLEAFLGSREHFLISTVRRELEEEGFTVYEVDYPGRRSAQREVIQTVLPYEEMIKNGEKEGEFILHFKTCLCVIYNFDKVSWIRLNYPEVILDDSGNLQHINAFEVYGYWAAYGMADALPQYYTVSRK